MYLKPTKRVESLLSDWVAESQDLKHHSHQGAFNAILTTRRNSALDYYIMPRKAFPNGLNGRSDFVNLTHPSDDHQRPYWSHANYIIGFDTKREHFLKQGLWSPGNVPTDCGNPLLNGA